MSMHHHHPAASHAQQQQQQGMHHQQHHTPAASQQQQEGQAHAAGARAREKQEGLHENAHTSQLGSFSQPPSAPAAQPHVQMSGVWGAEQQGAAGGGGSVGQEPLGEWGVDGHVSRQGQRQAGDEVQRVGRVEQELRDQVWGEEASCGRREGG